MAENPGAISQGAGRGWGFQLDTNVGFRPVGIMMNQRAQEEARKLAAAKAKQDAIDKHAKYLTDTGVASLRYKKWSRKKWGNTTRNTLA